MSPRCFAFHVIAIVGLSTLIAPAPCQAQPAPPLSQLQAEFVSSGNPNYWDVVPVGGFATNWNQNGPILHVGVLETGYAIPSSRIAKFNGATMSLYRSDPQYGSDRRVWGYLNYYQYTGTWTSGTFTYQASSLVYPYRTLSMRIYVQ